MVLSASAVFALARQGDSYAYFKRQLLWVGAGVLVMLVVSRIDYRSWRRLGTPLLVVAVAGLVYVLVHPGAVSAYGSTRWIALPGGLTVQPAEFAKLALLLFSADVLTRKGRLLGDVRHLLVPVLPLTIFLAALVMLEPDLGTTLLLCAIAFGMLFVAGTPLLLLGGIGALGLTAGIGLIMSADYRRTRFLSFMDPAADPQNGGYQFIQGRLALGSGGLLGVGLGAGRQKWSYVPNAHTDFIFAIIGEELGLLGTLSILLLFLAFAYAGVRVAQRAPDPFGRYLAGGITIWIVVQALVNIGAVVGVLPITGVPLPLVSFGGSSMLVLLAATGMLLNVARHEVWSVRTSVIATTRAAADRRGRRSAGRARRGRPGGRATAGPREIGAARRPSPPPAAASTARPRPRRPRPTPNGPPVPGHPGSHPQEGTPMTSADPTPTTPASGADPAPGPLGCRVEDRPGLSCWSPPAALAGTCSPVWPWPGRSAARPEGDRPLRRDHPGDRDPGGARGRLRPRPAAHPAPVAPAGRRDAQGAVRGRQRHLRRPPAAAPAPLRRRLRHGRLRHPAGGRRRPAGEGPGGPARAERRPRDRQPPGRPGGQTHRGRGGGGRRRLPARPHHRGRQPGPARAGPARPGRPPRRGGGRLRARPGPPHPVRVRRQPGRAASTRR